MLIDLEADWVSHSVPTAQPHGVNHYLSVSLLEGTHSLFRASAQSDLFLGVMC